MGFDVIVCTGVNIIGLIVEVITVGCCKIIESCVGFIDGRCVVVVVGFDKVSIVFGQHTPGTNRLLKHNDCRKLPKFNSNCGQSLKSSQYLKKCIIHLRNFNS